MADFSVIYYHWNTTPPRGAEIDANNNELTQFLSGRNQGTTPWDGIAVTLQVFANNAAAITGGLVAGQFYRTGGDPDTVCVVH